ncbi:hypothetical protein CHLRE_12g495954v5 [Chlamydomonas reinhardtii]|uniref:Uncharacterized protein n=1 Tax=Chlamydomonas reinhardtii TaxID=3055 RepID=A0A2K3D206_CHLRE|nr:uncharacterized protein CHLRE_12g495954v5 [Chlamydomonas reinhardtii]PNW74576.1 hypothetical protein CHLRE_12g495954v5 [Chlamydomonas reinhardtii]
MVQTGLGFRQALSAETLASKFHGGPPRGRPVARVLPCSSFSGFCVCRLWVALVAALDPAQRLQGALVASHLWASPSRVPASLEPRDPRPRD